MKQGASFAKKQGTLIALACAAAFAVPQAAVAQVATPDFGAGKGLTLSVDFVIGLASKYSNGATKGITGDTSRRTEVFSSSSSFYLKGSEKLSGSIIQGWGFVLTADYDPDEYNRRGMFEVGQTILGITTPAGAFFLGVNDNPYKQIGSVNVATGSTLGNGLSQSGNLGTPGFRTSTAKGSRGGDAEGVGANSAQSTMSFYRLNSNSVNWYSPSWNGFKLYAQWVPEDGDKATGITTQDQSNWSLGATYANGPFNIGYVYERRKDYFWGAALGANTFGSVTVGGAAGAAVGTGEHSSDKGQVLTAGYQFGNFKIGGYYQRMEYSQSGQAVAGQVAAGGGATPLLLTDLEVDSWYFGVKWRGGPHEVGAFYFSADDYECSGVGSAAANALVAQCQTDTSAKGYGLGYRYTVSKQLRLFASGSRYDNDARANYSGHSTTRVGAANSHGLRLTNFSVGITGSF